MLKASKREAIFKIRFPLRVVEDYDVDRLQVYNRNIEPSNTNCPIAFLTSPNPLPLSPLRGTFSNRRKKSDMKFMGRKTRETKCSKILYNRNFSFLQCQTYTEVRGRYARGKYEILTFLHLTFLLSETYSGGYSTGVPPLPIPNREVKPGYVDGTASLVGE